MEPISLHDKIICTPLESDSLESKFITPDLGKEKPQLAVVLNVGRGLYNQHLDIWVPLTVKKDDIVLVPKMGASSFTLDGKEYYICREYDLLAVIKNKL